MALLAIETNLSSTSSVVELMMVWVPSTWRLPRIVTVPVASPTAAGSRTKFDGPVIVAVFPVPTMDIPMPVVSNFLFPS